MKALIHGGLRSNWRRAFCLVCSSSRAASRGSSPSPSSPAGVVWSMSCVPCTVLASSQLLCDAKLTYFVDQSQERPQSAGQGPQVGSDRSDDGGDEKESGQMESPRL